MALGADAGVAGMDKASGLAGVIVGFCELAALIMGVTAWASRRRTAGVDEDFDDSGKPPKTANAMEASKGRGHAGGPKYVVDLRGSQAASVGDGGIHYVDLRGARPPDGPVGASGHE